MAMLAVHESLEQLDARVVQDALAYIDAFYASTDDASMSDAGDSSLDETDDNSRSVHRLCDALAESLDGKLVAMDEFTANDRTDAHLQLPASYYHEIQKRLVACQWLGRQLHLLPSTRTVTPLTEVAVTALLQRRLDEIIARVSSRVQPFRERTPCGEDVSDQYFDHAQSGVAVRFRSARFIPFKMSILTTAMWSELLDGFVSGPGRSQVARMELKDEIRCRFRDDPDGTEGVAALRRVHLPDGTMLLCWTAISAAPHATKDHPMNILGDLEVHQFGSIRIGRLCDGTRRLPRVFLESMSEVAARPACAACTKDHALTHRRFDIFKTTIAVLTDADLKKSKQRLENRMLDVTLQASGRHR